MAAILGYWDIRGVSDSGSSYAADVLAQARKTIFHTCINYCIIS